MSGLLREAQQRWLASVCEFLACLFGGTFAIWYPLWHPGEPFAGNWPFPAALVVGLIILGTTTDGKSGDMNPAVSLGNTFLKPDPWRILFVLLPALAGFWLAGVFMYHMKGAVVITVLPAVHGDKTVAGIEEFVGTYVLLLAALLLGKNHPAFGAFGVAAVALIGGILCSPISGGCFNFGFYLVRLGIPLDISMPDQDPSFTVYFYSHFAAVGLAFVTIRFVQALAARRQMA